MMLTKKLEPEPATVKQDGREIRLQNPLPLDQLEVVPAWGGATSSLGYVYRPSTIENLQKIFELAHSDGHSLALRGAGNSYGDATLNNENIVIDIRRLNRILNWDPVRGHITVEPGVTIAQLWEYVIEDGWWPMVVPGTSKPTIGGCAGMNVHGKNAWKVGTIGDHILEFDMMLPNGEIIHCNREENSDLFFAAIGGFGMLGTFTSITLELKKVHSGLLKVHALASGNLQEMMAQFDELMPDSDYLVGWIDGFPSGRSLGRGQIHQANYLAPGEDPYPQQTLRVDNQHLSDTMFGIVPRSIMWRFMRPFMNDLGARLVNQGKYLASKFSNDSRFLQHHVAFHFLLDYVPNFKRSYGRAGLIQYQCFIPLETAADAMSEILRLTQKRGLPNYLAVFKRHRPDDFLISHGLDGYSMAMDFKITPKRRARILALAHELDEIVLEAGGRFYFAKDSTLRPEIVREYLGADTINQFARLKERTDPQTLLQTNLWRRLFAG